MSEVIIGIDLGTTNSLVAVCENGIPRVLQDKSGESLIPSVIHFDPATREINIGTWAREKKLTDSSHTAFSVKRFMGLGKKDLNPTLTKGISPDIIDTTHSTEQNVLLRLGNRTFSAIELSGFILKKLKKQAEEALGQKVEKAVITVPAYFNDSQRSATKAAGTLAGLNVVRIVNEPTAAALAYGLQKKKDGIIAVYDLGGGTFDISVLKIHEGLFEVLSTHGDTSLGGDDFDKVVFEILKTQLPPSMLKNSDLEIQATLLHSAEEMKVALGNQEQVVREVLLKNQMISFTLDKKVFETQALGLVDKTIRIAKLALSDAGLKTSQVDEIVMVGGSTRLKIVQDQVKNLFGKTLNSSINPDECVALGAAIQADILSGKNTQMVLLDVVPLSLGIETYGGTVGKLIHRNSKIPLIVKETFTTHVDGQKNVLIHVLQGERELAVDCRSLARFDLKDLPPGPAGLPKIEVTFIIDANGILKVRAQENLSLKSAAIEVKPTYGLTDEQIEGMLQQSFDFAEKDMKARQLIDTRVEAEGVLRSLDKILQGAGDGPEILMITKQALAIKDLVQGEDYIAIKDGLEKLEELAQGLAEKVMSSALKGALTDKHVDDVIRK